MLGVEVAPTIVAGLIAGAVMEGPVYLQKALRLPVKQNIFRTWGLLFGQRGAAGWHPSPDVCQFRRTVTETPGGERE